MRSRGGKAIPPVADFADSAQIQEDINGPRACLRVIIPVRGLLENDQVTRHSREQLCPIRGDEDVVDYAGPKALLPEEDGWFDAEHHPGPQNVGAAADHVDRLSPRRRKAGRETVAGGVNATMLQAGTGDLAFGGLVRYDRWNASADLCNAGIACASHDVGELA